MSTKLFGMKNKVKKVTVDSVKEAAIEVKVELESKELRMNKITKENFLGIADKMTLPKDVLPYAVMALNYDCNSKVGKWTNLAMAICTSLPTEYFNEDGTPNKNRLMKAFKCMTLNGTVEHYESIFKERINVVDFFLKEYGVYKIRTHYVSNKEIKLFKERLENLNLNTLTVEDVKTIQSDLWFLFRAWQESSIDMTKDKSKQFELAMDEILGRIDVRTNVKFADIIVNNYAIEAAKYNDEKEIPDFIIDFGRYDDENEDSDVDYIETTLSVFQHKLRCSLEPEMQEIANVYVRTNNSRYEKYNRNAKNAPELAKTISNVIKIAKDCDATKETRLTVADYMILRAVIYQEAQDLEVKDEEVVKVALGTAGTFVGTSKRTGEAYVADFDAKTFSRNAKYVERLFGNILVAEKGHLYESEMVTDNNEIKVEVEPIHIFADVDNGVYEAVNGDVYDGDALIFDIDKKVSGKVEVTDDGVYYLYDVYTELDKMPEIDVVISNKLLAEEEIEERGTEVVELLTLKDENGRTVNTTYTLVGNELQLEDEEGLFSVMTVESGYALGEDEDPVEVEINNWYGTAGGYLMGEKLNKRNNVFMLLSYNELVMKAYLEEIKHFC